MGNGKTTVEMKSEASKHERWFKIGQWSPVGVIPDWGYTVKTQKGRCGDDTDNRGQVRNEKKGQSPRSASRTTQGPEGEQ